MSSPSPPSNRLLTLLRSVMGNAAWDGIKSIAKLAYHNWPLVLVIIGFIGSAVNASINRLRGIPSDAVGILVVFGIVVLVALLGYVVGSLREKKGASGRSGSDTSTSTESSEAVSAQEPNLHAQCKNTIRLLQEDLAVHSGRADTNESIFKRFEEKYKVAIRLADQQASEIGKFVEVVRVCTHDPKLDDPMPTIKWAILLKNRSVHRISLDGEVGPLFFEGHKLTENKDILENNVMGLYPERDGSIVFEQRLSMPEVNLLKSLPNGKFQFDKVMLYVKGSDAEHVTSHRVVIFSRFRATLGKCSDEQSQAVEELSAVVDNLRAQLVEAKSNSAGEKIAERKALIASWRACVSKAYRDYQDSGWSFTGLLATQDEFLSMTPNLSSEVKEVIELSPHPEYDDVRRLVNVLAEDIARIEREWGL